MGVLTGASLGVTAFCAANPKACFGSCPTFYAFDGAKISLQAEGFSDSIAKVFEKTDIDSLYTVKPKSKKFKLIMTNDALETHAVKMVRLIAVPRLNGQRVYRWGDKYYSAKNTTQPDICYSELGDCLEKINAFDNLEYLSPTDSENLTTKETIMLRFPYKKEKTGLIISARNSLLNTFLFYQTLAYMGLSAGDWMMMLNRLGKYGIKIVEDMRSYFGGVDIDVLNQKGKWIRIGSFSEIGPIAKDVQIIVLPRDLPKNGIQIRITMAKGNWKINYLALAELGGEVKPFRLKPVKIIRNSKTDKKALELLNYEDKYLMTYPQDRYTIIFDLPDRNYELFLESRGYYYEWIRDRWLKEENQDKVFQVFFNTGVMMKNLAPIYKDIESNMEKIFWQSKIGQIK
jgi:hypothetical protein